MFSRCQWTGLENDMFKLCVMQRGENVSFWSFQKTNIVINDINEIRHTGKLKIYIILWMQDAISTHSTPTDQQNTQTPKLVTSCLHVCMHAYM